MTKPSMVAKFLFVNRLVCSGHKAFAYNFVKTRTKKLYKKVNLKKNEIHHQTNKMFYLHPAKN